MLRRVRERAESMTRSPRRSNGSPYDNCPKCAEKDGLIVGLQDTVSALEYEQSANKEVVQVLQTQIDALHQELRSLQEILNAKDIEQAIVDTLSAREREAGEATSRLKHTELELEKTACERSSLATRCRELENQVKVMQDIIGIKDNTVMELTNQVYELEHGGGVGGRTKGASVSLASNDFKELDGLRDSVRAYKELNEVLTQRNAELIEQRADIDARNQKLQLKCKSSCNCGG